MGQSPIELSAGNYRLCFTVNMGGKIFPLIAFANIYPFSIRKYYHPLPYNSGIGFEFSPICVASERFSFSRSISDFTVQKPGQFNICATTSNWTSQVKKTTFELMLLHKQDNKSLNAAR